MFCGRQEHFGGKKQLSFPRKLELCGCDVRQHNTQPAILCPVCIFFSLFDCSCRVNPQVQFGNSQQIGLGVHT